MGIRLKDGIYVIFLMTHVSTHSSTYLPKGWNIRLKDAPYDVSDRQFSNKMRTAHNKGMNIRLTDDIYDVFDLCNLAGRMRTAHNKGMNIRLTDDIYDVFDLCNLAGRMRTAHNARGGCVYARVAT